MLANFFVLWLLLAVGGGFLLFFGGLLASWIGEEMVCFLLATALLALAGALIIQLRERLQQTRRRLEEETDRLRRMEEKLDQLLERQGLAALCGGRSGAAFLARPRKQEIFACFNRYRGLRL